MKPRAASRTPIAYRLPVAPTLAALGSFGLLLAALAWLGQGPATAGAQGDERGWSYLIDKLTRDGVSRPRALAVFHDPRVERFTSLEFSLAPRESSAQYRGFLSTTSVERARLCRERYAAELEAAEARHGVSAGLLAAILHVETQCGRMTGSHVVLYRLARLAMANEPSNLRRNAERHARARSAEDHTRIVEQTRQRGRYLEDTFYPEVLATFRIADLLGIDPLGIRGSPAGAFGMPQFLPSSYLRFGIDGNGDGRVSLFDPADAIPSCANYLAGNGWRPGLPRSQKRDVIWTYNRSSAYIDTVLSLSERLS
jgi:membrane-bound lytic murein transglycosylase B